MDSASVRKATIKVIGNENRAMAASAGSNPSESVNNVHSATCRR